MASASARAGYLDGVVSTARLAASGGAPEVVDLVGRQIRDLLGVDACTRTSRRSTLESATVPGLPARGSERA